jgi:hypothetical protein
VNLLLVTFALRNSLRDYDSFFVALRGNSQQWLHYIDSTFLVFTPYSPDELTKKLMPHFEATDSILVVPVTFPINGWLPLEAWTWITERVNLAAQQKLLPR